MGRTRFQVSGKRGDWTLKNATSGREVSHHKTKEAAIHAGARKGRADGHAQLIVKKENGQIQEERTYGEDPFPPKG